MKLSLCVGGLAIAGLIALETTAGEVSGFRWLYPQMELELYRVREMMDNARRMRLYAGYPGQLPAPRDKVCFRRRCEASEPLPELSGIIESNRYDSVEGRRYLSLYGGYRGGGAIRSDKSGWEAQVFDGSWRPVAVYPDSPTPPHRERLPEDRSFNGLIATNGWYDAGLERLAYVECVADEDPQLFVGESIPELMAERMPELEYDPTMDQVADGRWRTRQPLAFRFLRFKRPAREVKIVPVGYQRPLLGTFETANARWAKLREVGVRTIERCSLDFLIDGIKRDRLPWAGDLTVAIMADAYLYGDPEVVRRTLSVMDAFKSDVNGIVNYSMWTIISHDLYQRYFADRQFLQDRWWRIRERIENLVSRTDADGFVTKDLDWVFVDWAEPQSDVALQVIWYGALMSGARLAERVGDSRVAAYRGLAAKVRTGLDRRAWDAKRGLYRANLDGKDVFGRQANIFAIVFEVADVDRSRLIAKELAADRLPPVGTPYVYGFELMALCRSGYHAEFLHGMEKVFGAMLDAGATTFWEGYNASAKGDERYAFYGRPWANSLCHAWSAWPAFMFVSEVMGVKPTSDGWATWEQKPIPGVEGLRAKIPTPMGMIDVGCSPNQVK